MNKKKFIVYFIGCLISFFFISCKNVCASEITVHEYPSSTSINYGEPLYMSELVGGSASVEGNFVWKNSLSTFDVGQVMGDVLFIPSNENFDVVELKIPITINPRRVYLKFEKDLYKQYDSLNTIKLPNYVVGGIINKEVYVSGEIEGKLESVLVGENIKVNLSGIELKGDKKDNYYLDLNCFTATIYPRVKEEFGNDKNKIEFSENIYVPINSSFKTKKIANNDFKKDNYVIKEVYELNVFDNNSIYDINGKVTIKIKVDDAALRGKKIKVFNYYNEEYKEVDYEYKNGYLSYSCEGLGILVIANKKTSYVWLYIVASVLVLNAMLFCVKKILENRKKINKYRSLKRRRDYANY